MPTNLTNDELRIAEAYISVLDFVSRCAQAVDEDDFYYLYDKAAQLEGAAARLYRVLDECSGRPQVRRRVVKRLVAVRGRFYRACRLLHPPTESEEGHR